jgi:hypothetical protein
MKNPIRTASAATARHLATVSLAALSCGRVQTSLPDQSDAGGDEQVALADADPTSDAATEAAPDATREEASAEQPDVLGDEVPDGDGSAACGCDAYSQPVLLGNIDATILPELSGLAASRSHAGVLYAHNDSGDAARFFALRDSAVLLGEFDLFGATAVDWEDIAVGPCPSGTCVFLGDTGDNDIKRAEYAVYRVAEPDPTAAAGMKQTVPYTRFRFIYPDGPHNAETLLVHPTTGDVYVVTKVGGYAAHVYRLPSDAKPDTLTTLVAIGPLGLPAEAGVVTAGDIAPCGTRVILRTYGALYEFRVPAGGPFEAVFAMAGSSVPVGSLIDEPQGEAVAYAPSGFGYYTASESRGAMTVGLHMTTCALRP